MTDFSAIGEDPAQTDADFPATYLGVAFDSHGAQLVGVAYLAAGAGPHPTALLLHGFPGHEQNRDLAQTIRRAGWNVILFHYRGAWGSGGDYRFLHVIEDVKSAIAHFKTPEVAQKFRVDPQKIVLIGHSLGGWSALINAIDGAVDAVASIAAPNLGTWGETLADSPPQMHEPTLAFFRESLPPLAGVTAEDLRDELLEHYEAWDFMARVNGLKDRHVLLVAGALDDGVPPEMHHTPMVALLEGINAPHLTHTIIDHADHAFSDRRVALAKTVLAWLGTL
ncbi:MAG: alpha/beta fold hydrolase [Aggregatilineales bacterium]